MVGQVYYYQIKIFLTSTGEYNGVSRIKYGLSMAPLAENISDSRTLGDRQILNPPFLLGDTGLITTAVYTTAMNVHIYLEAPWPKHSITVANLSIPTDWADTPAQPNWSDKVSWGFEKDGFAGFIVGKFSKSAPIEVTNPGPEF